MKFLCVSLWKIMVWFQLCDCIQWLCFFQTRTILVHTSLLTNWQGYLQHFLMQTDFGPNGISHFDAHNRVTLKWFDFCSTVHHQLGKVIQMNQLDATMICWSKRSAQHVSGNILPIIRSVRLRYLQHMLSCCCGGQGDGERQRGLKSSSTVE